jgi:hypothetical protein
MRSPTFNVVKASSTTSERFASSFGRQMTARSNATTSPPLSPTSHSSSSVASAICRLNQPARPSSDGTRKRKESRLSYSRPQSSQREASATASLSVALRTSGVIVAVWGARGSPADGLRAAQITWPTSFTDVDLERKRHRLPPSATDVCLEGDEVAPDADDGDAGHFSRTYIPSRSAPDVPKMCASAETWRAPSVAAELRELVKERDAAMCRSLKS